jgi:hypothetical protein
MATVSGRKALAEIDQTLAMARRQFGNVSAEFSDARAALARLRQSEVALFARLAGLRLVELERGELVHALDDADREAERILAERDQAQAELERRIDAAQTELAGEESRRAAQQATVDEAGDDLDAAEAEAQAALAANRQFAAQLERTEQADFVADQAEEKAAAAERDRIDKGRPYEEDPLFSYLWDRGYGTSAYRAWPLTRWLDGRVAKLCDYEAARRNYSRLIEIPERLTEHAQSMRANFEGEAEALASLEEAAAGEAGVPERSQALEAAEAELAAIDESIAASEARLRALLEERGSFAAGQDRHYLRAIEVLSAAMQRRGVALLTERAQRTFSREDDAIVRELAEHEADADRLERNLEELRRIHEHENRRVSNLEDVRRRFKAARFDDSLSEFRDWAMVALVLREFLRGAAGSADVWRTIERQQRKRRVQADPDFGSLRFPRGPRRGPWRMPRGGGFGGGGFRSGGGFRGGGGFRSGGGF